MIYNLLASLKAAYPGENFYVNAPTESNNVIPDRMCNLFEVPSTEEGHSQRVIKPIQFTIRDIDHVKTNVWSNELFNSLINCYDFILPSTSVEGVVYPALSIGAANPGNPPYNLGPDAEGRNRHVFNVTYYYRRIT